MGVASSESLTLYTCKTQFKTRGTEGLQSPQSVTVWERCTGRSFLLATPRSVELLTVEVLDKLDLKEPALCNDAIVQLS